MDTLSKMIFLVCFLSVQVPATSGADVDKQLRDLHGKLANLEHLYTKQSEDIKILGNIVTYTSAFTATINKPSTTYEGKTLLFPDVIMKQGQGYDEKTSVFTAPVAGIYAFHFTYISDFKDKIYSIGLKLNNDVIVKGYMEDKDFEDQASSSAVLSLKAGDKVKVFMNWIQKPTKFLTTSAEKSKYCLFSGYLINPFV